MREIAAWDDASINDEAKSEAFLDLAARLA
jgi:hypothetical protein